MRSAWHWASWAACAVPEAYRCCSWRQHCAAACSTRKTTRALSVCVGPIWSLAWHRCPRVAGSTIAETVAVPSCMALRYNDTIEQADQGTVCLACDAFATGCLRQYWLMFMRVCCSSVANHVGQQGIAVGYDNHRHCTKFWWQLTFR